MGCRGPWASSGNSKSWAAPRWQGTPAPTPNEDQPRGADEGSPVDIKSFVLQKSPRSDMQFASVVAFWYRFEAPPAQRSDSINGSMLQEAARLAGRRRPPNPGTTLNNAKNHGYLDSAGKGAFALNSVGENLVAMTLGGDGSAEVPAPGRRKRKPGRKGKKNKTPRKAKAAK